MLSLPTDPADLTLETLNQVIGAQRPDVALTGFTVTETEVWGSGKASSAGRIVIAPDYAPSAPAGLPKHIVIKVARALSEDPATPNPIAGARGALYANEVAVHTRLDPPKFLEAPLTLGGAYSQADNAQMLLIEDLRDRGASFASVEVPT